MSKIYSLDTNIISYFLKDTYNITQKLKNVLLQGNTININPITYYEIKRGLLAINNQNMLNKFELFCNKFDLKGLDIEVFNIASTIHANLRKKGITIEDADILIASNAIRNNYILVTHNIKHFKNIENLNYENWIEN